MDGADGSAGEPQSDGAVQCAGGEAGVNLNKGKGGTRDEQLHADYHRARARAFT